MITVKVSYTVKPEFVDRNHENIAVFLDDFKKMNTLDFNYEVFLLEDRLTFLHLSSYLNEAVQQEVLNVPAFKNFQKQRDDSGLNNTHHIEILTLVGCSRQ